MCSIVRLFYTIKLYHATDITYYIWLTGSGHIQNWLLVSSLHAYRFQRDFSRHLKKPRLFRYLDRHSNSSSALVHLQVEAALTIIRKNTTMQTSGQVIMNCCPMANGQRARCPKSLGHPLLKSHTIKYQVSSRERMCLTSTRNKGLNRNPFISYA